MKGFRGSPLGKHCELPQLRKYTARGCFNVQRDNTCFTRPLFPKWIKTISIGGYSVIPKICVKWEKILPVHVKHTYRIWWTYHFLNVLLSSRCLVATKSLPGAITHKHWSEFLENLNKIYEKVLVNYFSLEMPWESRSSDNHKTLKRSFANVAYFVIYRSLYLTWITLPPEKKIWLQKKSFLNSFLSLKKISNVINILRKTGQILRTADLKAFFFLSPWFLFCFVLLIKFASYLTGNRPLT